MSGTTATHLLIFKSIYMPYVKSNESNPQIDNYRPPEVFRPNESTRQVDTNRPPVRPQEDRLPYVQSNEYHPQIASISVSDIPTDTVYNPFGMSQVSRPELERPLNLSPFANGLVSSKIQDVVPEYPPVDLRNIPNTSVMTGGQYIGMDDDEIPYYDDVDEYDTYLK
jgi:hypothetical protein